MPWIQTDSMNQKIQLIADWLQNVFSITDLSHKYKVSRPIIYKWIDRYERFGLDGLKEQCREPIRKPNQTNKELIDRIVAEKLKNRKRGPKKIHARLQHTYPHIKWPAPSTIGEWLRKHGLVNHRKKRLRVPPYSQPFHTCDGPNTVWSTDYKGQFYTQDGSLCYPLTLSDNYSRYLLACKALRGPRYHETRAVFEATFREYGLPDAIRMDNGTPFAGRCVGGLSRLMIWWIKLGITPERIAKGCPQQNSRHERMHRTLKYEGITPPAKTFKEQQHRFDWFRHDYNEYRPHESLGQMPPGCLYRKSAREYIDKPMIPDYDSTYIVRQVRSSGDIKYKNNSYFLTELLSAERVGLQEVADGLLKIYYSFYTLGTLDLRKNKIIK